MHLRIIWEYLTQSKVIPIRMANLTVYQKYTRLIPLTQGFTPYYIFLKLGVENTYPFIFNREGVPGKDEPYSRCNLVLKNNDQYLIPDRTYKSGYAEDSEPCFGIEKLRIVHGSKDIKWFVSDDIYQSENDTPEKTEEIYLYSGGVFCFSEDTSVKLAVNKISIKDLKNLTLDKKDFKECAK